MISKGKEFSDVQLRVNEKKTLNMLNKDKNRNTIRSKLSLTTNCQSYCI